MHRVSDSVVQQCDNAGRLADLVSGVGPVRATVTDNRVVIQRNGDEVDILDDPTVAEFFSAAPYWLRVLAEAVATIYTKHSPLMVGDPCPECGAPDPCHTRRLLDVRITRAATPPPTP